MSYFIGQGKVYLAIRNSAGPLGGYTYIGDVSEFKVDFTQKFDDVRENTSGSRQIAAHLLTESDGKILQAENKFCTPVQASFSVSFVEGRNFRKKRIYHSLLKSCESFIALYVRKMPTGNKT